MKDFLPKRYFFLLLLLLGAAAGSIAQVSTADRPRVFDVQHYTLRFSFDRDKKIAFGDVTVKLTPLARPLDSIELDAVDLKFATVTNDLTGKPLEFKASGGKVQIKLEHSYSAGEAVALRFKYTVNQPKNGIHFITASAAADKIRHPAQIWTQNEPEFGRYWFPSFDFPSDKATSEQFLTAPKGETAIGNGELLETTKNADGTSTFHYRMEVPHSTYLTSFVIGNFIRLEDKHRSIPLAFYTYTDRKEPARIAFSRTAEMMAAFESLTGVNYPFPKYDQIMVSGFEEFSGMENITATTLADNEVLYAEFPFLRGLVDDLVAHELAHSWFGNLVTCRNWSELWLNEGFATFMEAASREKAGGRAAYIAKLVQDRNEFFIDEAQNKRHPLQNLSAKPDNSLFDVTTYQKGGLVVHMLRESIGDASFWKGINLYLNRHKFDNVVSSDLQAAMEEASGQKLQWFFDQWVYRAGYPKLEISHRFDQPAQKLSITISQSQKSDELTPDAFRFPLEIEFVSSDGKVTQTFDVSKRTETFSVDLKSAPTKIVVDPSERLILKSVKMD